MTKPKTQESVAPAAAAPGFFEDTGAAFSAVLGFNPGDDSGDPVEQAEGSERSGGGEGDGGGGKREQPAVSRAVVEIKHLFDPLPRSAVPATAPGSEGTDAGDEGDGDDGKE
jgi:hypothetical protein